MLYVLASAQKDRRMFLLAAILLCRANFYWEQKTCLLLESCQSWLGHSVRCLTGCFLTEWPFLNKIRTAGKCSLSREHLVEEREYRNKIPLRGLIRRLINASIIPSPTYLTFAHVDRQGFGSITVA